MRRAWNQARRQAAQCSTTAATAGWQPRRCFSLLRSASAAESPLGVDFSASAIPSVSSSLPSPLTRYACVVEYDGSLFHGWSPSAERSRESSVAGAIEACVSLLVGGRPVKVMGSGRTDRGVHGQAAGKHKATA